MHKDELRIILAQVVAGKLGIDEALTKMQLAPIEDTLQGLTLDMERSLRTGLGEVVFAQNKNDLQLLSAMQNLASKAAVLATRVNAQQMELLLKNFPQGHALVDGGLFSLGQELPKNPPWASNGDVLVISAGAADRPVALEAFGSLHFWGIKTGFIADVGVAGLHRLKAHVPAMHEARAIIAVAGMEGALPSVLAGLVRCPIVAVPTSVGYGVGQGGLAALSTMLCTCAPGIAVCNIDNGFGAAAFVAKSIWSSSGKLNG